VRRALLVLLLVIVLLTAGCFQRDATRDLTPEQVLHRVLENSQEIQSAHVYGELRASQANLQYEGVAVYRGEESPRKLVTFSMENEAGEKAGVDIYITPRHIFVRWPDSQEWTVLELDSELAEGWVSIVEQTKMADPAYALERIVEAAAEVAFVSDEEGDHRQFKVLRVEANLDRALELFAGVLPPELPTEAYADFHHTIWVDKRSLEPYRFSIHLQINTSTGDLLPIHMEFQFRDLNRASIVLPAELKALLEGGA